MLAGDSGANRIEGGDGDDLINGHAGDDWLVGGAGADRLDGGAGFDTVEYSAAPGAVFVRLWAGDGQWSDAAGDRLAGIEAVIGTAHDDVIAGGAGNDTLIGGAGDDFLSGQAGDDRLEGGAGNDTLLGGAGNDVFVFADGGGSDVVMDFEVGDRLDFSQVSGITSFADFQAAAVEEVGGFGIRIDDGEITIQGISLGAFQESSLIW
jgi:Ca2+-binding RTX toxin-like protein